MQIKTRNFDNARKMRLQTVVKLRKFSLQTPRRIVCANSFEKKGLQNSKKISQG